MLYLNLYLIFRNKSNIIKNKMIKSNQNLNKIDFYRYQWMYFNKIIVYFDFAIIENSYFLVHFNVFHFVKNFILLIIYLMLLLSYLLLYQISLAFDVCFFSIFLNVWDHVIAVIWAFESFRSVEFYIITILLMICSLS